MTVTLRSTSKRRAGSVVTVTSMILKADPWDFENPRGLKFRRFSNYSYGSGVVSASVPSGATSSTAGSDSAAASSAVSGIPAKIQRSNISIYSALRSLLGGIGPMISSPLASKIDSRYSVTMI